MSKSFRIIAVRPLYNCDKDFRKSLKPGQVYKFYNNYTIEYNPKSDSIDSISQTPHISEEIFNLDNGISVSVSALVGKNGSGKSTLFDLLYLFIYILSSDTSINSDSVIRKYLLDIDEQLEDVVRDYNIIKSWDENPSPEKVIELSDIAKRYNLDIELRTVLNFKEFLKQVKSKLSSKLQYLSAEHKDELKVEEKIASGLKMSIIYEIDGIIYELTHNHRKFNYSSLNKDKRQELDFKKDYSLSDFFYNVCLNYSHHSLNSTISGKWIMKLFHKNDGYITPVVINPMRIKGNFDINKEIDLSKERLMINIIHELVREKQFLLLNKYEVTSIIFSPKKPAPYLSDEGNNKYDDFVSGFLLKSVLPEKDLESLGYYKDNALGYLEKKIPKIRRNYRQIIFNGKKESNEKFEGFVKQDKSHISKKVRQTLEFFRMTNTEKKKNYWKVPERTVIKTFKVEDYIKWMKLSVFDLDKLNPFGLIDYAHPGFLNVDFELKALNGEAVKFGDLSSGEQQMIYNENTILYHLFNLQSVHQDTNRIKYRNVNLILDEVELYYHPEMQQNLVRSLVTSIENIRLKGEKGIDSVNIILCTHSPFILSDIPKNNVLRLKGGDVYEDLDLKSFGANFYDILSNDFFMQDFYMGSMAKEKINEVIKWLDLKRLEKELEYLEKEKKSELGNLKISITKKEIEAIPDYPDKINSKYAIKLINIIDEPLLKQTIKEMYYKVFPYPRDGALTDLDIKS